MENVAVHIISHSHWDREWYLPFESHRMQLVELLTNLFDLLKMTWVQEFPFGWTNHCPWWLFRNSSLKTVTRFSVISTKASSRLVLSTSCRMIIWSPAKLTSAIPWLDKLNVLNGANLRRLVTSQIPFGNMGQAPQIFKNQGIHVAAFGRGVSNQLDFDKQVLEDEQFTSQFSEMYWQGGW